MIKLIACDLDGTLLDQDHEITDDNRAVVEQLRDQDFPFVIATGRIYPSALEYSRALGLSTPIISCNGAVIKDPIKDEIIFDYPLGKETLYSMIDICHKYKIYFHFYGVDTIYAERYERLIKSYDEWKKKDPSKSLVKTCLVDDMSQIVEEVTLYKLGLYTDEPLAKEALADMMTLAGLTSCYSLSTLVDVFCEKASKGQGLRDIAKLYGVDMSHTMAIGDNENDIPMIEAAGLGVAMAGARDFVKAKADVVTGSNDDSGVAQIIRKHLKLD